MILAKNEWNSLHLDNIIPYLSRGIYSNAGRKFRHSIFSRSFEEQTQVDFPNQCMKKLCPQGHENDGAFISKFESGLIAWSYDQT